MKPGQPDLNITQYAYDKMCAYIDFAPGEVSGFGTVDETKSTGGISYTISDVFILPQVAGGAHATISTKAYAAFVTERLKAKQSIANIRLWWHSHAELSSFFSGTDTGTIDDATEFPLLVSVVGNKAKTFTQRIDIFQPFHATYKPDTLWIVKTDKRFTSEENDACEKEVLAKVKNEHGGKIKPLALSYPRPAGKASEFSYYGGYGSVDNEQKSIEQSHRETDKKFFDRMAKEDKQFSQGFDFFGY